MTAETTAAEGDALGSNAGIPNETYDELLAEKYQPIAIVGIGLRFPGGSNSPDSFETFLREGRSGIGPLPRDRWDVDAFTPSAPDETGKIHTVGGGFLDRIDEFDAGFFNISPKEAQYIDPQQRLLLETAWHALENAGIDPAALRRGNGGVYVGASSIDYALEMGDLPYEQLDGLLASGITMFPLSGRISYFLGWRGPSVSVDTACSSSLTALHMAVQGLRRGECDIALVGGVNALHHPRIPIIFSNGKMLAPDGQCKTFDESADGYVRAEGCGVVVLTRLSTAEREGHDVVAVIRGTAVGQDGDSAGLTVPNGSAQAEVMRKALDAARLTAGDIQYVEAHGTGTPLGDPIEMGAINDVFAESHDKTKPLLVGSVKTNLGHMEPASGIVGLIKAALQVRTGMIYPHLNLTTPSGRIPWNLYPVEVPTEPTPWIAPTRRAVVNSFGFAGTIAAVVVEQAPQRAPVEADTDGPPGEQLFTLSAKGASALRAQARAYLRFLDQNSGVDLAALCHAGTIRRSHHSHRLAAVVSDRAELTAALMEAAAGEEPPARSAARKSAWLFTGQGSQYAGMGAGLYQRFPVVRQHVDECDRLFTEHLGRSVKDLLLGDAPDAADAINQTWLTQPALFTLEYALARLWMSWGVRPAVLIGHSIGEVAAAAVAEVFSLPDAALLVATRARLMQSVSESGGMAAVGAPADQVEPLLADRPRLSMAAVNGPAQCVVSGGVDELDEVIAVLKERGVRVDRLAVSHAFHSPLMAQVADRFRAAIAGIEFRPPVLPMISNVTGAVATAKQITNPDYWARHIGEPVAFLAGMGAIARRGKHAMMEIGPSRTLLALGRECVTAADHLWLPSLSRREPGAGATLRSLGELYRTGFTIAWSGVHDGRTPPPIALPLYDFQRKRYWLPAAESTGHRSLPVSSGHHPLLGRPDEAADGRQFTAEIAAGLPVWGEYTCDEAATLPFEAYLEVFAAVQEALFGHDRGTTRDVRLHEPLLLPADTVMTVHTRVTDDGQVSVASLQEGAEVLHATATVHDDSGERPVVPPDVDGGETHDGDGVYVDLASAGRRYGNRLRTLLGVTRTVDDLAAELQTAPATFGEHLPAAAVAGALQALGVVDPELGYVSAGMVRLFRRPRGEHTHARIQLRPAAVGSGLDLVADVLLLDGDRPAVELRDVGLSRPADPQGARAFEHRVVWEAGQRTAPAATVAPRVIALNAGAEQVARLAVADGFTLVDGLDDAAVTDVAWFWRTGDGPASADRLRSEAAANYRDLLASLAAIEGAGHHVPPRLWLVTEHGRSLPGDEAGDGSQLAAATLWGFGAVLRTEYPHLNPVLVDLGGPSDLDELAAEWRAPAEEEFALAFRDAKRHVQRLLGGPGPEAAADNGVRIRPDRTYVITGGLGGLGLVTARKFVDLGARHLVLVSRSGEPTGEAKPVLEDLQGRASVRLLKADLAVATDVERLTAELRRGGIPVGGFVHAAGAIGKDLIAQLDWATIDQQFGPKVYGGWLLHEASAAFPEHEFFVLYSSIASVIGGATQAHYAGASAFLEGLADWRAGHGLPALSVNWGAWAQVGMSARLDAQLSAEVDRGGVRFFSPARALDTLADLLRQPVARRIVGRYDWAVIGSGAVRNAFYERMPAAAETTGGPDLRRLLREPDADPVAIVGDVVRRVIAAALQITDPADLDPSTEFMSLGLDSLMALEVRTALETAARLPLPASLTFDHPSPRQLTDFLLARLGTPVEAAR